MKTSMEEIEGEAKKRNEETKIAEHGRKEQ